MRSCLLAIALVMAACHGVDAETKAKKPMTPLQLTWSMKVDGKRLRIDYKVTNTSKSPVLIVDKLITQNAPNAEVVVVRNDTQPKTIAFTRAHVTTKEKVMHIPMPAARSIAPGETVEGVSISAWPPFAWHNYSKVDALAAGATHAVFELGYVDDADAKLVGGDAPNGYKVISKMGAQKLVRGDVQPLPH